MADVPEAGAKAEARAREQWEPTILDTLFQEYPDPQPVSEFEGLASDEDVSIERDKELFHEVVNELRKLGFIRRIRYEDEKRYLSLTVRGYEEILRRRGIPTITQLEEAKGTLLAQVEEVRRIVEENRREQDTLGSQLRSTEQKLSDFQKEIGDSVVEVRGIIETNREELTTQMVEAQRQSARLDQKITDADQHLNNKLDERERDFYSRIIPLLALVVSAFALLLGGVQNASRASDAEPLRQFATSVAVMAPVGIVVVIFVAVAWGITRVGSVGFWREFWNWLAVVCLAGVLFAVALLALWLPARDPTSAPPKASPAVDPSPAIPSPSPASKTDSP